MEDQLLLQMSEGTKAGKSSIFRLLQCKCPRCRKGNMFQDSNPWHLKNTMKMNKECPVCKQPLDIEVGFYFGSSYVSYALSVALSAASFMVWYFAVDKFTERTLVGWLVFNALFLVILQPYLMRVSRTGWLAFFVRYDRNWKNTQPKPVERTNRDQENNW